MGKLILHIGTTKTGTTSLQEFCLSNREKLAERGVAFPVFSKQPRNPLSRNGNVVHSYCLALVRGEDLSASVNDIEEDFAKLGEALHGPRRVLLSDECISFDPNWLLVRKIAPSRYWGILARTLTELGARDVTIVLYLRRQDLWISSQWRQSYKTGHGKSTLGKYSGCPPIRFAMDYASMIATAEAAFEGCAKVVVRRYDRQEFEGGDIYRDFCHACDIPWSDDYELPLQEANESLSFDVAEALRPFAEPGRNISPRMRSLVPLAMQLSRRNPDPPGMTPFDEEETRLLIEPYLAGNEWISEKYLDGKPLFSDEYGGRPVWVPNEGRIAEYRSAFERALQPRLYQSLSYPLRRIAHLLPDGVRQVLKSVGYRMMR